MDHFYFNIGEDEFFVGNFKDCVIIQLSFESPAYKQISKKLNLRPDNPTIDSITVKGAKHDTKGKI